MCHGDLKLDNIVIRQGKAMLYGPTNRGSPEKDIYNFGGVVSYIVSNGASNNKNNDIIQFFNSLFGNRRERHLPELCDLVQCHL